MPIPAAELALITGVQTDLAAIKTALASIITRSNSLYDLRGDAIGRNACLDAKGGARELLGLTERYHADLGRAIMNVYGVADAGPVIMGGGGGRR